MAKKQTTKKQPDLSVPFEFEHNGQVHSITFPEEITTVGFARKNRHLGEADQLFLIIESGADEDTLAVIDTMKSAEFMKFQKRLYKHLGISLGESTGS